jgi:hypothetical protein
MSGIAQQVGSYKLISATGNVAPIGCKLLGIFASSSTVGTVTVYDSATTTTAAKVIDTVTLTAGVWYPMPVAVASGLYIVVSGTLSATVVFA